MTAPPLVVGQEYTHLLVEDLTRTQIVMYAGASGDYNPLHTDELYAREAAGFPGVFAHGMLTMAMVGRAVTDLITPERLMTFGGRFKAQVWPGDTLTATVKVDEVAGDDAGEPVVKLSVVARNQEGEEVFAGYATGRAP